MANNEKPDKAVLQEELDKVKEQKPRKMGAKPFDSDVARAIIEEETGKKIDEIYSEFSDKPLGAASMGQVHYAVLKDGTKVVTKVQRPLIAAVGIVFAIALAIYSIGKLTKKK